MTRLIFVGELNPYGKDPRFALYHLPRRASGDRLREIIGLTDVQYARMAKINLCTGKWSTPAARRAARELFGRWELIVGLGVRVREALDGPPPFEVAERHGSIVATLPHPSGLCRAWGEPGARERARALLGRYLTGGSPA